MNREERRAMERAKRRLQHAPLYIKAKRAHGRAYGASDLDASQVRDLSLIGHAALTAITQGTGTAVDVDNLALLSNVSLVLAGIGLGSDLIPEIHAGQDAILSMQARLARIGKAGATGTELQALNTLMELHDAQLSIPPTVDEMRRAVSEVRRRREAGQVLEATQ
jgi:hypothetical protein